MPQIRTHRQWTPLAHALAAVGDQWKLLIVLAVASGPIRLSSLKEQLPGISTGVLEHHVHQMVELGLLSRQRFREVPPRVELELTDSGHELLPIASALARWGMRRQWSAPDDREQVEADALVRQLPALLEMETDLPSGTVEAVLAINDDRLRHWFQIDDGRLQASDRHNGEATGCIEGDEAAWIAALGPQLDHGKLRFGGDGRLALQIFDALARTRLALWESTP